MCTLPSSTTTSPRQAALRFLCCTCTNHTLLFQLRVLLLRDGIRLGRAHFERNKTLEGSALKLL